MRAPLDDHPIAKVLASNWTFWISFLGCAIGGAVMPSHRTGHHVAFAVSMAMMLVGLVMMLASGGASVVIALKRWNRFPPGCCKHCGYNLAGNVSGRCPECGQQI